MKIKLNNLIAAIAISLMLASASVYALNQGAYATLVFGVGALNQITVYELTTGSAYTNKGVMNSAGGLALSNIEFNSTTGNTVWQNATMPGGAVSQDATHPMIYIDNTGTTTATDINISVSNAAPNACLDIRYITNQSTGIWVNTANPSTGLDLNTTAVRINATLAPTDSNQGFWLYGNFSSCVSGSWSSTFYINATF